MMERIGRKAVLLFASPSTRMLVTSDTDTVMQYSVLDTASVFESFICESRSENVIAIEVHILNLLKGLKPAASFELLTMKLTKRGVAQYLRVETRPREGGVALVQDIPVRVIAGSEMMRFTPPALPPPKLCVVIPHHKVLCPVVDRMRALGKTLEIEVHASPGESAKLTLSAVHDQVRVRTFFPNLISEGGSANAAAATLSLPDFAATLKGISALSAGQTCTVKLSLVPPTALYLSILLDDGSGSITVVHIIKDTGMVEGEGEGEEESPYFAETGMLVGEGQQRENWE